MIPKGKQEAESNILGDYAAKLQKYMNKGAETAQASQEKKAQPDEVDALVLDLLKQVMIESSEIHPALESTKAESSHLLVGTQKPKADIPKPAPEKSGVKESQTEKPAVAKVSAAPVASMPATLISAASAKQKSKTPLIAIVCVCALAAIAIPVYRVTGSFSQASHSAASLPAAIAPPVAGFNSSPADQTAAVPIVKVVPKYPNLGVSGISGSVVLELSIEADGTVLLSRPLSGNRLFYSAAIETASQWRFKPARANGKNVPSRTRITLYFRPQR